jgi:hypothetical protein
MVDILMFKRFFGGWFGSYLTKAFQAEDGDPRKLLVLGKCKSHTKTREFSGSFTWDGDVP